MSARAAALLRRVVDVREAEIRTVLLSGACSFFIFASFYVLRPLREEMGVAGGVKNLAWMFTGTWIATLLTSPLFGFLVSRYARRQFIPYAYRFFVANLLVFFVLFRVLEGDARLGLARALYIWVSVYNLFVVAVFWGYMADIFTSDQGKRLFGFIAAGGTLGAIAGSGLTTLTVEAIGTMPLLLVAATMIEASLFAFRRVDQWQQALGQPAGAAAGAATSPAAASRGAAVGRPAAGEGGLHRTGIWGGLTQVLRSPYLLGIVLYMLCLTCAATFTYNEQARAVAAYSDSPEARTAIFARIDLMVNLVALGAQALLTGRILGWLGVGATSAILPLVHLVGFVSLMFNPGLGAVMGFQVARRSTDYAAARPAREVFYTVLEREEKYKAKSFIDTFVYRGGDALAGWLYKAIVVGGDPAVRVAMAAFPLTGLWLFVCIWLGRRHRERAAALPALTPAA